MDNFLVMKFNTENGKSHSIRIPKANPDVTLGAVKSAMNQILGAGAVKSKNGALVSPEKAYLQKVTVKEYAVKS
jgi:hypothetical protein